jgi:ABC-type transport system involved in multi-copper enzyme maturation permease subunit
MTQLPIRRRGLWFIRDVITQAELRHQWYILEKSRSGTAWILIAVLMILPAILVTFYLLAIVFLGLPIDHINPNNDDLISNLVDVGLVSLITMNVALYLIVILITLGLSSNSITRERKGRTWDVLVLSNVDARQVVLGKWWASLVALWGDHAMIGFLRIGLVCMVVITLEPFWGANLPPVPMGISPIVVHTLILSLILSAYTAIDAMFTAALGVGGAVSTQNASLVGGVIFMMRFIAIFMFLVWLWTIYSDLRQGWGYITTALFGLALFAVFTWLALRLGEWWAIQGEVNAP